jgi:hypothetical protein
MEATIMMLGNDRRRRNKAGPGEGPTESPTESLAETSPTRYHAKSIRVPDDGFTLTGRRYAGYHREVTRRQAAGIAQDDVYVWTDRESQAYVKGTPRVNEAGELEILNGEKLIGTVRLSDGALYFYPAE